MRERIRFPLALAILTALSFPGSAQAPRQRPPTAAAGDVGAETASHVESGPPLSVHFDTLASFCMTPTWTLLACDSRTQLITAIEEDGAARELVHLDFGPEGIEVAGDGTIFTGCGTTLAKLSPDGTVLKTVAAPTDIATDIPRRRRGSGHANRISGMAVTDNFLFVTFGSGWSTGAKAKLFRFDLDLENPTVIAEGLRGCCQRCDITSRGNRLYLAENAAFRGVCYDESGNILNKWGTKSRTGLEGFGSCCNPMNVCFGSDGNLYTSESGVGRVKRYTPDGTFLGLVGYTGVARFSRAGQQAAACSNIAVAVGRDGDRVYVMDYKTNQIRVLQRKL